MQRPKDIQSNSGGSSTHCDSCNRNYATKYTYGTHIARVHKMKSPKYNSTLLPYVNAPKVYCASCQFKYRDRSNCRSHLNVVHKVNLTPHLKKMIYDSTVFTDDYKNIKNRSCTICKFTYSSKNGYQWHMKNAHNAGKDAPIDIIENTTNADNQPGSNDFIFYCKPCEKQFSGRCYYCQHIRSIHPNIKLE